jgi:Ca2+-binding EF-hand superfamily protein
MAQNLADIQKRMLQQFDLNKDGALSPDEQLRAQEEMRRMGVPGMGILPGAFPGADQFMKQFDRDGDGQLNNAEQFAAAAAFQRMRGNSGSRRPQVGAGGFGGFGAAGGGAANAGAAGNGVGPAGAFNPAADPLDAKPGSKNALVKRFDKDGDGKLSAEEKADLQAELKKKKGKAKTDAKPVLKDKSKATS